MSGFGMEKQRCWAEIDLAAFERNVRGIQSALPPVCSIFLWSRRMLTAWVCRKSFGD